MLMSCLTTMRVWLVFVGGLVTHSTTGVTWVSSRKQQLVDALRRSLWLLETLKDDAVMEDRESDAAKYRAAIQHVDCAMQELGIKQAPKQEEEL